jgi:hypothetical protein
MKFALETSAVFFFDSTAPKNSYMLCGAEQ